MRLAIIDMSTVRRRISKVIARKEKMTLVTGQLLLRMFSLQSLNVLNEEL